MACSWEVIDGTVVHINRLGGYYIGQTRRERARNWRTVTGRCRTPQTALAKALLRMNGDYRARALWVGGRESWYEPHVAMTANPR